MARSLSDKVNSLSKERQVAIQDRANELIAEEMSLRDLRVALNNTQVDLSAALHMNQDGVFSTGKLFRYVVIHIK